MPHDIFNKEVKVGDIVYIPCKVVYVQIGDEYCNVDLETLHPMPPYTNPTRLSAINTKQIQKSA